MSSRALHPSALSRNALCKPSVSHAVLNCLIIVHPAVLGAADIIDHDGEAVLDVGAENEAVRGVGRVGIGEAVGAEGAG